jgi:hypothetical protein
MDGVKGAGIRAGSKLRTDCCIFLHLLSHQLVTAQLLLSKQSKSEQKIHFLNVLNVIQWHHRLADTDIPRVASNLQPQSSPEL